MTDEPSTMSGGIGQLQARPMLVTLSGFVLGSALFAVLVAAATATVQAILLTLSGSASSAADALTITLAHAMSLVIWLWPLTMVGAITGAWIALRDDIPAQTGVLAVAIGAVAGALAATQLMAPADALSHELAAWAVLAPAGAVLLAISPWPGAIVRDLPVTD